MFELSNVDKYVIKHFSKRRETIEKVAKERGYTNAKDMEKATVNSRKSKQNKPSHEVIYQWDKEAKDIGFEPNKIKNDAIDNSKNHNEVSTFNERKSSDSYLVKGNKSAFIDANTAVDYAIKIISQKKGFLSGNRLLHPKLLFKQLFLPPRAILDFMKY